MTDVGEQPWPGGAYSVKRHGVTLTSCDAEPIQTPGCIQAHGALVVARLDDLAIVQVSENVADHLGRGPAELLGRLLADALGSSGAERVRAALEEGLAEANPLRLFTLDPSAGRPALDVIAHTVPGLVLIELEPAQVDAGPALDLYPAIRRAMEALERAISLVEFCELVCRQVRAITGLDRVMVYKFHEDGHGEVFAESRRPDLASWLGLHYPAEDIPRPAREIFTRIWLRPVPDVAGALAELVPLVNPVTGAPLVMTHCVLRGPSVMYTEYLQNMGVGASLTMSLRRGDQLWGLIAGHHQTAKHIAWPQRAACELFAQVASHLHRAAEEREDFAYREGIDAALQGVVAAAAREQELAAMAVARPGLADLISCGGAALHHAGRWWRAGNTPEPADLDALATWVLERPELGSATAPMYATDRLPELYPPAAGFAELASGVLAVPLSRASRSLLMWFRPEVITTISWAGAPDDKPVVAGPHGPRLTPRRSFELFRESVRHRALPWKLVEREAVLRLRTQVMEVVVHLAARLVELNADLARTNEELDAFAYVASHDLKEPLRGIYKYAHQLREDPATPEVSQARLDGLLRLALRMDGLLDSLLHYSRVGRVGLALERVELDHVVAEALEIVRARVLERRTQIVIPRPLPAVACDHVRTREIVSNLVSNALKYNDKPERRIEIGYVAPDEPGDRGGAPAEASHALVLYVRDNGIGIPARYHEQVFRLFRRLHRADQWGGGTGAGLTIVAKLIERQGGRIWLDSVVGAGTTFYFTLGGAA
jgi:light-regulated signal transduction histidine kinase (bacteriophytochrome)